MYCIVVRNQIKPGMREHYLEIMLENARASVRQEEGCEVFDVLEAREESDCFYLYEIYKDEAALQQHKQTEHYLQSRKQLGDMVVAQSVIRADRLG